MTETKKNVIKQYRVEQCYHFVRQNKKDELNYWRELNNKTKFEQVKKIANYPKFDKVIFPTVQNYYQELKYPQSDNRHISQPDKPTDR